MVALVGGGGKTSAVLRLTSELRSDGMLVLATTTTRAGRSMAAGLPLIECTQAEMAETVRRELPLAGAAFLVCGHTAEGKYWGPEQASLRDLLDDGPAHVLIVEADGARQLPLKAPAEHEPVIPDGTDIVVPMAGLDAIGRRISPGLVHRPEILSTFATSETVTPALIAAVLTSDRGGMKGVGRGARVVPVLNKLTPRRMEAARETAGLVLDAGDERLRAVVLSDLHGGSFIVVERGRC